MRRPSLFEKMFRDMTLICAGIFLGVCLTSPGVRDSIADLGRELHKALVLDEIDGHVAPVLQEASDKLALSPLPE